MSVKSKNYETFINKNLSNFYNPIKPDIRNNDSKKKNISVYSKYVDNLFLKKRNNSINKENNSYIVNHDVKYNRGVNCKNKGIYNYINNLNPNISYSKLAPSSNSNYKNTAMTFTRDDINNILSKIDLHKTQLTYVEPIESNQSIWYDRDREYKFNKEDYINTSKYIEEKIIYEMKSAIKINPEKYLCSKVSNCIPKTTKRTLIKLETNNDNTKYTFLFEIHIPTKLHSHVFYCEIEVVEKKYYINILRFIGIRFGDKVELLPGLDSDVINVRISKNPKLDKYNANNDYYRNSNEIKKIILPKNKTNLLVKKQKDELKSQNDYRCYGKTAFTKSDCESKIDELGVPTISGIWDKKCKYDSECPFYMKNKNYPNRRGGCIDGKCELPLGYKLLGNRYFDKKSTALCYNCKTGNLKCCEEQKNKDVYPELKSPDYVFSNDFNERYKYKDIIQKNNLKIY